MNVAFDPKLIDHLELRENALKERDAEHCIRWLRYMQA